jgi:hypothetical protein
MTTDINKVIFYVVTGITAFLLIVIAVLYKGQYAEIPYNVCTSFSSAEESLIDTQCTIFGKIVESSKNPIIFY